MDSPSVPGRPVLAGRPMEPSLAERPLPGTDRLRGQEDEPEGPEQRHVERFQSAVQDGLLGPGNASRTRIVRNGAT